MDRKLLLRELEIFALVANYHPHNLARVFNLSPSQLRRQFARQFACSPRQWLTRARLEAAKSALASGDQVKAVALRLGYDHVAHFSRWFRQQTGVAPTTFAAGLPTRPFPATDRACY